MNRAHVGGVVMGSCLTMAAAFGQNLIPNSGFELGNTQFSSDYAYSSGGNCCEGQYTVRDNGNTFNGFFTNPPPSSAGSVQMMVCNGSTLPNIRVWYATIPVQPGRTYGLGARGCTAVAGGPAVLQWQIDGVLIGSSVTLPSVTRQWVDVPAVWTAPAGVTSAVVAIRNLNTSTFPNDFYVDDLSMVALCRADFDADGFVDFFDFAAFTECFAGGACPPGGSADFDGDGFVDFFDLDAFVAAFEAGC